MRNLIFFLVLCLSIGCKEAPSQKTAPSLSEYFSYTPQQDILISAHRGGRYYQGYPENCLETIQYVQKQIPHAIFEVDVAKTKDGILVLMHDKSLDRTTTGFGPIDEQTWSEIQPLRLKDDFGNETDFSIPSFESVLKWADTHGQILMVDVKRSISYEQVLRYLEIADALDNAVIITYSADQAKKLYSLNPKLMLSVSIRNEKELRRMEATGIPYENMVAFTGTKDSPQSLFDAIHERGMMCILGTLGNLDKQAEARGGQIYKEFARKGVDIFATDRPLEVANVFGE